MKPFEYRCKLCGLPGTAQCDDGYDAVGDPNKLVSMLCHDKCYDIWSRRKNLEDKVFRVCVFLVQGGETAKKNVEEKARGILRRVTQAYSRWLADSLRQDRMIWEEEIVNLLFDNPQDWQTILKNYRRHCEIIWKQQYETTTNPLT